MRLIDRSLFTQRTMNNLKYVVSAAVLTISPFVFAASAQAAGSLDISPSVYFNSRSIIRGATGVGLAQVVLDASQSGEDVRISTVQIRKSVTIAPGNTINSLVLGTEASTYTTGTHVIHPSGNTETLSFVLDAPLIVAKGTTQLLNLYGNISTTASAGGTYRFDFTTGELDWNVTTKDGVNISETLKKNIVGATMTVASTGTYGVGIDPSAPTEKWYPGGSTGVTVNVLRFTGLYEDMALTNLRLQVGPMGSSTAADIKAVELWDGSTLVTRKVYPAFLNGTEDFQFPTSGNGSFVIPKDSFRRMTIKVDLADIGVGQPGTAGQMVVLNYDAADLTKQKARGMQSSAIAYANTPEDTKGTGVIMFRSVPTVQGCDQQLTQVVAGSNIICTFNITADSAYDVAINKMTLVVATSGIRSMVNNPAGFSLFDLSSGQQVGDATGSNAAYYNQRGNYSITNDLVVRFVDNLGLIIPRGTTKAFILRANITTAGVNNAVATSIVRDDARPTQVQLTGPQKQLTVTAAEAENRSQSTGIIWSDFSANAYGSHSVATRDWMNSYKVPGMAGRLNVVVKDRSMPPIPTLKPDLTIASAAFVPNPPVIGSTTNVLRVVLRNAGNASSGSFKVVFARNETILNEVVVLALNSGATKELNFTLPQLVVGINSFFVRADYDNTVLESDESNNATTISTGQLKILPTIKVREITTLPHKLIANKTARLGATIEKVDRTNRTRVTYDADIAITEVSSGLVDFETKGTGEVIGSRDALRFAERWTPYVNGQYRYVLTIQERGTNATSSVTGVWTVPTPRGSSTSDGMVGGLLMVSGGLMAAYAVVGTKLKTKVKA